MIFKLFGYHIGIFKAVEFNNRLSDFVNFEELRKLGLEEIKELKLENNKLRKVLMDKIKYLVAGLHGELIVLDTPGHPDAVAYVEKSKYDILQAKVEHLKTLLKHAGNCGHGVLVMEADAAREERDRLEKALNQIGMLSMGELAYTKEFTEKVESICRDALKVEKRWPY